jgi:hypothetical protein
LVGSNPIQPIALPHHTETQAWVASAACRIGVAPAIHARFTPPVSKSQSLPLVPATSCPSRASTEDRNMHNVHIVDNNANWLAWGNLVLAWVNNTQPTPNTVADLRTQMQNANVQGQVQGNPNRGVTFVMYPVNGAIVIPLPNPGMVQSDNQFLRQLAHGGGGQAPYPLPAFYSVCFGGTAPAALSLQELLDMEARRIGEYVINECM